MASIFIADPGSKYGPCKEACAHKDCAASRKDAATSCVTCRAEIGYEQHFYARDNGYEHAACMDHRLNVVES